MGVFGVLYILSSYLMRGWAKSFRGRSPQVIDRLLGLGFGLIRGVILASLFVMVVTKSAQNEEPADWMKTAKTYPVLRHVSDSLQKLPFMRAKEIVEDIKTSGKESDRLPSIPTEE